MKKLAIILVLITFLFTSTLAMAEFNTKGLSITIVTGKLLYIKPGRPPYNDQDTLAIHTISNYFLLTGNVQGMKNLIGRAVEIKGYRYIEPQGLQFYRVVSYKVLPK